MQLLGCMVQLQDEGITMMKLMISAAAVMAVAAFTVPASADYVGGGPRMNTEGKCWKDLGGPRDGRYGLWTACPKAAAVNDSTCQTMGQLEWEKAHIGFQYFDVCGANAKAAKGPAAAAKPRTPGASR
jgi:hypothetical protein